MKQFFKPTVSKIVISVLLMIVFTYAVLIAGMECRPGPCDKSFLDNILVILDFPALSLERLLFHSFSYSFFPNFGALFVFNLVYSYLLASGIVFIANIIRNKS